MKIIRPDKRKKRWRITSGDGLRVECRDRGAVFRAIGKAMDLGFESITLTDQHKETIYQVSWIDQALSKTLRDGGHVFRP